MNAFRIIYEKLPATIDVPPELQGERVEVILQALAENGTSPGKTPAMAEFEHVARDANSWPVGFLERTYASLPDLEEIPRLGPGDYEQRLEFE